MKWIIYTMTPLKVVETKTASSFDYRCVFHIKSIFMENIEELILTITLGHMKYRSQFYGLSKKPKI